MGVLKVTRGVRILAERTEVPAQKPGNYKYLVARGADEEKEAEEKKPKEVDEEELQEGSRCFKEVIQDEQDKRLEPFAMWKSDLKKTGRKIKERRNGWCRHSVDRFQIVYQRKERRIQTPLINH